MHPGLICLNPITEHRVETRQATAADELVVILSQHARHNGHVEGPPRDDEGLIAVVVEFRDHTEAMFLSCPATDEWCVVPQRGPQGQFFET